MKYLLLICGDESHLNDGERAEAWARYAGELSAAGKVRGAERLRPAASADLRRLARSEEARAAYERALARPGVWIALA